MVKIVVDAMGGDNSPDANVWGSVLAISENKDIEIILVGNKPEIEECLKKYNCDGERLKIVHASEVIDCNDKPTEAIRLKKDSSMVRAFDLLKSEEGANALVTTGSTGALLAGAVLKLGRIRGVKRPGFCPILPTMQGGFVGVCDCGANVDCDALQLKQFALMGSLYMEKAYGVENPRVALLNVGVEEEKGDALRKEVYGVLKDMKEINFVGNMESRDLLKGNYDLVVSDGFAGNVLIKSTEGACLEVLKLFKKTLTSSFKNKLGALILKKDITDIKNRMDYRNYGGAVLLGCTKTIVKSHGSSTGNTVYHSIKQAYNMEKKGLRQAIEEGVAEKQEN